MINTSQRLYAEDLPERNFLQKASASIVRILLCLLLVNPLGWIGIYFYDAHHILDSCQASSTNFVFRLLWQVATIVPRIPFYLDFLSRYRRDLCFMLATTNGYYVATLLVAMGFWLFRVVSLYRQDQKMVKEGISVNAIRITGADYHILYSSIVMAIFFIFDTCILNDIDYWGTLRHIVPNSVTVINHHPFYSLYIGFEFAVIFAMIAIVICLSVGYLVRNKQDETSFGISERSGIFTKRRKATGGHNG